MREPPMRKAEPGQQPVSPTVDRAPLPQPEMALGSTALVDAVRFGHDLSRVVIEREPPRSSISSDRKWGLRPALRDRMERPGQVPMHDLVVHHDSARPGGIGALAFAEGPHISMAPGQEPHLAHEAWHVVQQKQGRVRPAMQLRSDVPVNDDAGLETEATVMGARALAHGSNRLQAAPRGTTSVFTAHAAPAPPRRGPMSEPAMQQRTAPAQRASDPSQARPASEAPPQPFSMSTQPVPRVIQQPAPGALSTKPIQLKASHARKLIEDRQIRENASDEHLLPATTEDIERYIADDTRDPTTCRDLVVQWNRKNVAHRIVLPSWLVPNGVLAEGGDDFAGWDSDEERENVPEASIKARERGKVTLKRKNKGKGQQVSVLTLGHLIRIVRQVVKRNEIRKKGGVLPLIAHVGPSTFEFMHPGTDDVYATPLKRDRDSGSNDGAYRRAGTSKDYNFSNLTGHLEMEQKAREGVKDLEQTKQSAGDEAEGSAKRVKSGKGIHDSLRKIPSFFRGQKVALTEAESEIVAAMMCDLIKGHAAFNWIESLETHTETNSPTLTWREVFGGTSPIYSPAARGGRGLVVSQTQLEHDAARILGDNNCFINAVTAAARRPQASFEDLVMIRSDLRNVGEMLSATPETVAVVRRVLGIQNPIRVLYAHTVPEWFPGQGDELTIYHGDAHFSDTMPDHWHEFANLEDEEMPEHSNDPEDTMRDNVTD
jgi:hypothetical protein